MGAVVLRLTILISGRLVSLEFEVLMGFEREDSQCRTVQLVDDRKKARPWLDIWVLLGSAPRLSGPVDEMRKLQVLVRKKNMWMCANGVYTQDVSSSLPQSPQVRDFNSARFPRRRSGRS